jgi:hypothetical protein
VTVERDAVVDGCIVADGVRVPAGAVHRNAILVRAGDGSVTATPFSPVNLEP